jgi:hypothetical protein
MAAPEGYDDSGSIAAPVPERRDPAWGYDDLALFIGAFLPAILLATILMFVTQLLTPQFLFSSAARQLTFQSYLYALLMGALYALVARRYHQTFWRPLGWTFPVPRAWLCLIAGPLLTITVSVLGVAMKAPESSMIEDMITSRASLALFILFGVVFAPIFEELLFRGFLFPLLARSFGPWLGIAFTAIPFGLLHGAQNHWAWQPVVLIGLAGAAFGYVRYQTGSTTASFLMHAAYNATGFAGYTLSHWRILN